MQTAQGGVVALPSALPRAARPRLSLLDPLRILASFAVTWHHVRASYFLGVGFGLFLFLVILFGLASSGTRKEPLGRFARRKAAFLLVPWVRWSLVYLVLFCAADLVRGQDPRVRFEPAMVFYGGHPALWFLPFAAISIVLAKALAILATRWRAGTASIGAALCAAILTSVAAHAVTLDLPGLPWRSWLRVSPALLWGIALGQTLRASEGERTRLLLLVALLGVVAYRLSPVDAGAEDLARRFAVAVALACLGFGWRPSVPRTLVHLGTLTFGVYLVHPLVAKLVATCLDVAGWTALEHVLATWIGSALIVLALRRAGVRWKECARAGS